MNWKNWILVGFVVTALWACGENGAKRGITLFQEGKYEEAVQVFDQYLSDFPNEHETLYNRGRSYEKLKQYNKALKDYRAASKLAPTEVNYWIGMGSCNYKLKQYDNTIANMDAILEFQEKNTVALVLKAKAQAHSKKLGSAMKTLELAIRYDENCGDAYLFRGIIRANARDIHTCEDLKKAQRLQAKGAEAAVKKYCD